MGKMFRLLVASLVAASALQASSFTFSSCTAGATTISPCGGDALTPNGIYGPDYMSLGGTGASDNSSVIGDTVLDTLPPIPSGHVMSVGVGVEVSSLGSNPELSAVARANAGNVFYSAGSSRSGFIQFDVRVDHTHGGNSSALLSDGTHEYKYVNSGGLSGGSTPPLSCDFEGDCIWTATVPFNLGSGFQVSTSADIEALLEPNNAGASFSGGDDALVIFRLLESDGTTLVPFSATPEPASWALLLFGLTAGWLVYRRRQRTH